jgi:hypothetical protein
MVQVLRGWVIGKSLWTHRKQKRGNERARARQREQWGRTSWVTRKRTDESKGKAHGNLCEEKS